MSRGLGKVERAVLKACCQCFYAKAMKKYYEYPGGIRFLHPENGDYIRGVSFGQKQNRILLNDEKLIDLKEVHFLFKKQHGQKNPLYQEVVNYGTEKQKQTIEQVQGAANAYLNYMGLKADEHLSPAQEASYQRAVNGLKKKGYLLGASVGYAPRRFVRINEKKIKPKPIKSQ